MLNINKDIILVHHHLGLGDHFICNGLIRYILEIGNPKKLYLPTKHHNFSTVQKMYGDDKRVVCLPVSGEHEINGLPELKLDLMGIKVEKLRDDWDVSFYDSVQIPFSIRWTHFKINRDFAREEVLKKEIGVKNGEKFVIIHDSCSTGSLPIVSPTGVRIIKIDKITDCLLDWCGLIEEAEEVHCVDSSVVHLAQSLSVKTGVFHMNRTPEAHLFQLKPTWKKIRY
jgi:hypothetical protein